MLKNLGLLCLFGTAALAETTELSTKTQSANQVHYAALAKFVEKPADILGSAALTEVYTHVSLENPMEKIYSTCQEMQKQIRVERTEAAKAEKSDKKMCGSTLSDYDDTIYDNELKNANQVAIADTEYGTHSVLWDEPQKMNHSRGARNDSIHGQELKVSTYQARRTGQHTEFLKLQAAFEKALGEIAVIGRVLNGEGTLGDLGGGATLLEEENSCSSRFARLVDDTADVPHVSSMLQIFSKSFAKVEATQTPAKNHAGTTGGTSVGTQKKVQANTGNMDAINKLLTKVRENLVKSMQLSYKQENKLISLWKTEKQNRRMKINDDWITNWENFKAQGTLEEKIGLHWQREGSAKIRGAEHIKLSQETQIMRDFLDTRCWASRNSYENDSMNRANELNALEDVLRYMKMYVVGKNGWSKNMSDVVSSPYKWKIEKTPEYVSVDNTYSTTANTDDPVSCRTPYSTVFQKVRILTQDKTDQKFVDPNDLTHTKNMNVKRDQPVKSLNCQQFPTGISLGRAHSCSKEKFTSASVDLTGTGYKFGKAAERMFKVLGRKTDGSSVKFTKGGKLVTIEIRGRCGDIYPDDSADADYRSDPIPLEATGI